MSKARHARPRRSSRRMVRTLSIAGLGAGVAAGGAGAAFAADYSVKSGDTLSEIAQAHGADWHKVAELNHLQNPNLILVGQTLHLDGVKKSATKSGAVKSNGAPRIAHKTATESRASRSETSRPTLTSARVALSGAWSQVANCESSGNPRAVNPSGHQGLFQFDLQTWRSVGGTGQPINASPAEQLKRAKMLFAQRGSQPWPDCGRFLR
jgi:murein DD-endopeptidase MepM/ murein hydrolase activator NlpD